MKSNTEKFGKTPHQPSLWTRADALKVRADDPTTTQPLVSANFPVLSDEVFIWDTMPLRDIDGNITSVDGWSVIFTLTADRHPNDPQYLDQNGNYDITRDWNDRHGRAKMYYWFSRTGKNWELGGRVMAEGVSPTVREWAGTPILLNEQGEVDLYYTAVTPGADHRQGAWPCGDHRAWRQPGRLREGQAAVRGRRQDVPDRSAKRLLGFP